MKKDHRCAENAMDNNDKEYKLRSKAGIIALTGECFTIASILWTISATLFFKDADPHFPGLIWMLLLALLNLAACLMILKKGASVAVLAVLYAVLLALNITVHILLYRENVNVSYVLCTILNSSVSVGVSLYYSINEQPVSRHLMFIDAMIADLLWLFLFLPVLKIETLSVICAVCVVLLDIGGAVVLRMSEGGMNEGIGRAFALAVGSAGVAAAVVFFLVKIFSRSQGITGAVLSGIRSFFIWIWNGIQSFFEWISSFLSAPETEMTADPLPQTLGAAEEEAVLHSAGFDPVIPMIAFGAIAVIIICIVVWKLRKTRLYIKADPAGAANITRQKKEGRSLLFWHRLAEKLVFMKNAFLYRNTPKGVLVWLEKRAARKKDPREKGESIRAFLLRLSPDGTLSVLADDLDAGLYGNTSFRLSSQDCKNLKKVMRRELKDKKIVDSKQKGI